LFPFVPTVAIAPELGSTYILPRLVGIAKACELMLTGRPVSGKEAKEIRLVNEAVPLAELPETTTEMARDIARASPGAVRLSKIGLYQGMNADIYSQLMWEEEALRATFGSEDNEEAIKAFIEKRTQVFMAGR
jgi:enoyl-CoA hydratase/carnithine racemase